MIHSFVLLKNELRNIFRDRMLLALFFYPVGILVIFSLIESLIDPMSEAAPFIPLLSIIAYVLLPMFSGMVLAFSFLDEKDDNVWNALRVTPINKKRFLLLRFVFPFLFSVVWMLPIPLFLDAITVPWYEHLVLALLGGMQSLILAILICFKAKNKVEGFTFVKIIALLFMLPPFALLLEAHWEYLFVVLPTYWTFKSLMGRATDASWVGWGLLLGIVIHLFLVWGLTARFLRRMTEET